MSDRALSAHKWFCSECELVHVFLTVAIYHQIHSGQCWESTAKLTGTSESFTKKYKTDCSSAQTGCSFSRWKMETDVINKRQARKLEHHCDK